MYGWPDASSLPWTTRARHRVARAWGGVKSAFSGEMRHSSFSGIDWHARPGYDYQREVGDGSGNSIVAAVVGWMARTFPEAPVRVREVKSAGETEVLDEHPMSLLLRRPNPYMSGTLLWMATVASWAIDGNAYWLKVRSAQGRVVQLWWLPHWMISPKWPASDDTVYISHYEYRAGGRIYEIDPSDVVHYRYGISPTDTRRGESPLSKLLREVYTDDEASRFTASILRNMGVPGVVISPSGDDTVISEEAAYAVKANFRNATTGEQRGDPIVMSSPGTIEQFGFSPAQLDLRSLRNVPEERVSGVFGVAAIVAGLGAGLARSTFANFGEAREASYEENIIPTQRIMAEELWAQLLVDFTDDIQRFEVFFDLSGVRVLREDEDSLTERTARQLNAGIVTRAEARRKLGYDAEAWDDVYLLPVNVIETPAALPSPEPEPAMLPAPERAARV